METPEYHSVLVMLVRLFTWHSGHKNKEGNTLKIKEEEESAMGTMHHPHGELQMFPAPAQQPPAQLDAH